MAKPSHLAAFNYASPPFANWPIKQITNTYTLLPSDNGYIINASGTFTINLVPAAPFPAGFCCWIWNTSNTAGDVITLLGNASQTIDASSSIVVRKSSGTQIIFDGVRWQVGARTTMRGYSENINNNSAYAAATNTGAMALGQGATGSGTYSTAIGFETIASASNSFAAGINSGASGSQAVTGSGAMALGGSRAAGTDSFAAAVTDNTSTYGAKSANAIALGYRANANGTRTIALGYNATASNSSAIAISTSYNGSGATASGVASLAIGDAALASGDYSIAIGALHFVNGPRATARGATAIGAGARAFEVGKYSYSGTDLFDGSAFTAGIQYGRLNLGCLTTNATARVLQSDGINGGPAPSQTNQLALNNYSAFAFTGTVVARQQGSGGTQSAAWKIEGLIRKEVVNLTTTLVASTVTAISNVPGWTLALSADITNGALAITATGAAATNIRWFATVHTSEIIYA